jgi:hypothetical protein
MTFLSRKRLPTTPPDKHAKVRRKMAFFQEVGAAVLAQVEFTSTEHVKKKGLPAAQSAAGKAAIPMIFPSRKRHPTTPPDKHARERRKMAFFQEVGAAVLMASPSRKKPTTTPPDPYISPKPSSRCTNVHLLLFSA